MANNYENVIRNNLTQAFEQPAASLAENLPAEIVEETLRFRAFGCTCEISVDGIRLDGVPEIGALGVVISLYLRGASPDVAVIEPLRAYKEFPDTMPYWGAFRTHTESILVPYVEKIRDIRQDIIQQFNGREAFEDASGDFAFLIQPLPKIFLCYIY